MRRSVYWLSRITVVVLALYGLGRVVCDAKSLCRYKPSPVIVVADEAYPLRLNAGLDLKLLRLMGRLTQEKMKEIEVIVPEDHSKSVIFFLKNDQKKIFPFEFPPETCVRTTTGQLLHEPTALPISNMVANRE